MIEDKGYRKLEVWKLASEIRRKVYQYTKTLPHGELRRISQMNDSARSVKQNIQEGYARAAIGDYIRGAEIARASLAELMGDIEDCHDDKIMNDQTFQEFNALLSRQDYLMNRWIDSLYRVREKRQRKPSPHPLTPHNPFNPARPR